MLMMRGLWPKLRPGNASWELLMLVMPAVFGLSCAQGLPAGSC